MGLRALRSDVGRLGNVVTCCNSASSPNLLNDSHPVPSQDDLNCLRRCSTQLPVHDSSPRTTLEYIFNQITITQTICQVRTRLASERKNPIKKKVSRSLWKYLLCWPIRNFLSNFLTKTFRFSRFPLRKSSFKSDKLDNHSTFVNFTS